MRREKNRKERTTLFNQSSRKNPPEFILQYLRRTHRKRNPKEHNKHSSFNRKRSNRKVSLRPLFGADSQSSRRQLCHTCAVSSREKNSLYPEWNFLSSIVPFLITEANFLISHGNNPALPGDRGPPSQTAVLSSMRRLLRTVHLCFSCSLLSALFCHRASGHSLLNQHNSLN